MAILDGGLATELEARGHDLRDDLWSARLLLDAPEEIQRLHVDYLEAGADCIVSASYQASFEGFARRGLGAEVAASLLHRSVGLARRARDGFWADPGNRRGRQRPLVAASVGPYGACLADGSEYTGDYGLSAEELARFHLPRLEALAGSGADLLACETLPSAVEASVLADLLARIPGARAWLSFSCRDGRHISDGTPILDAAARVADSPAVIALGVNCTAPRHVGQLLTALRGVGGKPLVAYPNSGEQWHARSRSWLPPSGDPASLSAAAEAWAAAGARAIGGCCRTGPREIAALRRRLLG